MRIGTPRRRPDTCSVLIPIVVAGAAAGRLLHVHARTEPARDDPRKLDPAVAPLFEHKLYRAGLAAVAGMNRLGRRPAPLLGGLLGRAGDGDGTVLSAVNGQDFKGLSEENAGSAELGLALALLMHAAQRGPQVLYASGALDRGDTLAGVAAGTVGVLPVAGLVEKLAAIEASVGAEGATRAARLFLPARTLSGADTVLAHKREIGRAVAAFTARGIALSVHPVATLDQALDVLAIGTLPRPPRERAIVAVAAAAGAGAALALLAWSWLTAPVSLAFGTLQAPHGVALATPFAVRTDAGDGRLIPQPACKGPDGLPLYRSGESVILKIEATNESGLVRRLGGTRFAIIGLSEISGVREWPEELISDERTSPMIVRIPIAEGPVEAGYIVVLARRVLGFGGKALRDEVRAVMDAAPREERLNAALAHLSRRAPGHLVYKLVMAGEDARCRG